jgi:hypothetical protein
MLTLPPQCAAAIETANQLVVDESESTVKQLLALANGDLCDIRSDGTRIYYLAPDISSLEYAINRTLGTPGAKPVAARSSKACDVEDALADIAHELTHLDPGSDPLDPEGPLRTIIGAVAKRRAEYKRRKEALDASFIEFLPIAIERLSELCSGVTVHREYNGKTRTYTMRPNRRAIEHISRRLQGMAVPIVDSLNNKNMPPPDTARDYTVEDIKKMTSSQLAVLFKALENGEKQQKQSPAEPEPELPAYYTAACVQMAELLPAAMNHMKTLARGATTIVESDNGERSEINHAPDPRANQFLIDLFAGAPSARFEVKSDANQAQSAVPIAAYTETIVRICTSHPNNTATEAHIRTLLRTLTETL